MEKVGEWHRPQLLCAALRNCISAPSYFRQKSKQLTENTELTNQSVLKEIPNHK